MTRAEILRLITVQNLVLLIVCLGWLWIWPNPGLLAAIRVDGQLFWAPLAALAMLAAGSVVMRLVPPLRRAQLFLDQALFSKLLPQDAFYLGLLPGVAEELMFRGLLQQSWGLLPAAVSFGLLHVPGLEHWSYAVWATLMGLALGAVYLHTGNLLLVMLIHVLNNVLALLLWPIAKKWYAEPAET